MFKNLIFVALIVMIHLFVSKGHAQEKYFGIRLFQDLSYPNNSPDTLTSIDCDALAERGDSYVHYGKYRWAYDSLKYYIEQCAMQNWSYGEFSQITIAATGLAGIGIPDADTVYVWKEYKNWLHTVLNLNPAHIYFCEDVFQMAKIYEYFSDTSNTIPDWNAVVSICRYSEDSLNCGKSSSSINESLIKEARHIQHKIWQDSVTDSLKTPLDTTLKSLDDIGLGFLRQYTNGVAPIEKKNGNSIAEITASPNPFRNELTIHYKLNESNPIRLDIFDVLGKEIWSNGQGNKQQGDYSVPINSALWSSGTYYARISTIQGEVKTIKLIHE